MRTDQPDCVANADFAELSATGLGPANAPDDPAETEFGPLGSPSTGDDRLETDRLETDRLETYCDTWGANAPSPVVAPYPPR